MNVYSRQHHAAPTAPPAAIRGRDFIKICGSETGYLQTPWMMAENSVLSDATDNSVTQL
jgi:hypothetical protein